MEDRREQAIDSRTLLETARENALAAERLKQGRKQTEKGSEELLPPSPPPDAILDTSLYPSLNDVVIPVGTSSVASEMQGQSYDRCPEKAGPSVNQYGVRKSLVAIGLSSALAATTLLATYALLGPRAFDLPGAAVGSSVYYSRQRGDSWSGTVLSAASALCAHFALAAVIRQFL